MIAFSNPLRPLEDLLTNILEWLHASVGLPWAWSIVALTVMVRIALVPLTVRQIHSMQNLQAHAPEMKALQQRWKHDRKRQNEELMKFYRENKINPAASCLPMLAQIPIFISLFYTLKGFENEVASLPKYAGDSLHWLGLVDITEPTKDGWGPLLLLVYVASQLSSSYLMSQQMQKAQRVLLMVLPIVFIPLILNFPAGLMVYWLTTNLWTTGQGIVTRKLLPRPEPPDKRSSRAPAKEVEEASPAPKAARKTPAATGGQRDGKPVVAGPPRRVKRKKGGSGGRRR